MERFSEKIIEHFMDPQNRGTLERPSGTGLSGRPGEGPFMVFQVAISQGIVTAAKFQSHNCGVSVACGSVLTTLIIGKPVPDVLQVTPQAIADALDGVPPDKLHVPEFAARAMRQALEEACR